MADKRVDLFGLLKREGKLQKVLVYVAQDVENDPYEHTKTLNYQQPQPVDALIQQISFEALRWKYWGQIPQDSVQILCEKKYEGLFLAADKIEIDGKSYKVYKNDSAGFGLLRRNDYLVIILERKIQ